MNILLTIVMCSSVANTCLEPFTFEEIYYDSYSCMVDGYKKSMEKTIEISEISSKNIKNGKPYHSSMNIFME